VTRLLDLSEVPVLETLVEVKELASVKPAEAFKDIAASISALTFFNVAKHCVKAASCLDGVDATRWASSHTPLLQRGEPPTTRRCCNAVGRQPHAVAATRWASNHTPLLLRDGPPATRRRVYQKY